MTTEEVWKPVTGYEHLYQVSNHGRVRSLDRVVTFRGGRQKGSSYRVPGKILNPTARDSGHLIVFLSNGKVKREYVHRLVLQEFVGPAQKGMECLHKDGNPKNNHLENLRWGTPAENRQDSVRHRTHAQSAKDVCKRGHPFSGPNLRRRGNTRICIACKRETNYAWVQKRPFDPELADRRFKNLMEGGSGLWQDVE